MLNALRRQRFGRGPFALTDVTVGPVLNALRRQRFGRRQRATARQFSQSLVLNALRRQRFGRNGHKFGVGAIRKCSTPYGVRGLVGPSPTFSHHVSMCAQRLTASEVWSATTWGCIALLFLGAQRLTASEVWSVSSRARRARNRSRCSTPYGVRGLVGRDRLVLCASARCAQRLTASEVWSDTCAVIARVSWSPCSTPYGVRGLVGLVSRKKPRISCMCSTPYGVRGLVGVWNIVAGALTRKCSTPYGVRGLVGVTLEPPRCCVASCSTPYGVRGLVGACGEHRTGRIPSAQRLTASEVWSVKTRMTRQCLRVCSTPYGVRGLVGGIEPL